MKVTLSRLLVIALLFGVSVLDANAEENVSSYDLTLRFADIIQHYNLEIVETMLYLPTEASDYYRFSMFLSNSSGVDLKIDPITQKVDMIILTYDSDDDFALATNKLAPFAGAFIISASDIEILNGKNLQEEYQKLGKLRLDAITSFPGYIYEDAHFTYWLYYYDEVGIRCFFVKAKQ